MVYKLRDYMKRMNNVIPICLIKLALIFRILLNLQFPISTEIFYDILLIPIIIQKDDLRKNIVQLIMDVIKEGLGIRSEDFLAFLESHSFPIPSELLNQIRTNNTSTGLPTNVMISPRDINIGDGSLSTPRGGMRGSGLRKSSQFQFPLINLEMLQEKPSESTSNEISSSIEVRIIQPDGDGGITDDMNPETNS